MSATGGKPSPICPVLRPLKASVVGGAGEAPTLARTACSTGVMLWVVNVQVSTMVDFGMPLDAAAASAALVNLRSGSSAQAFAAGIKGSVLCPSTQSGEVRCVRK